MSNKSALERANTQWGQSALLDAQGNPFAVQNPPYSNQANVGRGGGGGGGIDHVTDIAGLKKNVGFLNWATGIIFVSGLAAIAGSYLMLANKIDDRYDKIGDKIDKVTEQVSDFRVSISEVKANDQSQVSTRKQ